MPWRTIVKTLALAALGAWLLGYAIGVIVRFSFGL
jgi:hypothetical protein